MVLKKGRMKGPLNSGNPNIPRDSVPLSGNEARPALGDNVENCTVACPPISEFPVNDTHVLGKVATDNFELGESSNHGDDVSSLFAGCTPVTKPLQVAASQNDCKVYVKSPERVTAAKQPDACKVVDRMLDAMTLTTGPNHSYTDIVRNIEVPNMRDSIHDPTAAEKQPKLDDAFKHNYDFMMEPKRSFYDNGQIKAFGQIVDVEGRKVVSFSAKEILELAAPFQFTLIGKFSHGFPTIKTLKLEMANFNLIGPFSVSLLEYKHVLIRLSCEEDYTRLCSRQVLYIDGFPMRVLKWTPDFVHKEEPCLPLFGLNSHICPCIYLINEAFLTLHL